MTTVIVVLLAVILFFVQKKIHKLRTNKYEKEIARLKVENNQAVEIATHMGKVIEEISYLLVRVSLFERACASEKR